jgi:hypothetical protein
MKRPDSEGCRVITLLFKDVAVICFSSPSIGAAEKPHRTTTTG